MDLSDVDLDRVPHHVALVMDGNGRWATRQGLKRTDGHAAGEEALWDVVYGALELGVKWVTVYAFSTENWKRSPDEVKYLMNFNQRLLIERSHELNDLGVRIKFAGRRNWRVPKRLIKRQDESIELTKNNRTMTLTMAFNYGGRAEIIDAMKAMVDDGVASEDITEKRLRQYFYDPEMPDPDLMVRTSGEFRISNFLLWEIAYSELIFVDTLWPDFRREDLRDAIIEYQGRERRFGGVNED